MLDRRSWYVRQSKDPYVKAARELDYRSRAAFKLVQLHERFRIFSGAKLVVDLGAAPGGWSQVASEFLKNQKSSVVAIDLLHMESLPRVTFFKGDFTLPDNVTLIKNACLGFQPDVILSDMSPNITGIYEIDHLRSVELVRAAFAFARSVLSPGGNFVAKIFQGCHTKDLEEAMKLEFSRVAWFKPEASRKTSSELYIVGIGKHPVRST